jgi:two-component system, chemotaxis family, chemotaxis protein CheY
MPSAVIALGLRSGGRVCILLVDDHAEVRAVLVYVVAQICPAATIVQASDVAEALSMVSKHRPDLIITDYQMPVMTGLELVRTLRSQHETLPVLLVSSDPDMATVALAVGE